MDTQSLWLLLLNNTECHRSWGQRAFTQQGQPAYFQLPPPWEPLFVSLAGPPFSMPSSKRGSEKTAWRVHASAFSGQIPLEGK